MASDYSSREPLNLNYSLDYFLRLSPLQAPSTRQIYWDGLLNVNSHQRT
jgi:hypothetical protein